MSLRTTNNCKLTASFSVEYKKNCTVLTILTREALLLYFVRNTETRIERFLLTFHLELFVIYSYWIYYSIVEIGSFYIWIQMRGTIQFTLDIDNANSDR